MFLNLHLVFNSFRWHAYNLPQAFGTSLSAIHLYRIRDHNISDRRAKKGKYDNLWKHLFCQFGKAVPFPASQTLHFLVLWKAILFQIITLKSQLAGKQFGIWCQGKRHNTLFLWQTEYHKCSLSKNDRSLQTSCNTKQDKRGWVEIESVLFVPSPTPFSRSLVFIKAIPKE